MEAFRPIDFTAALTELQAMIDEEVNVVVNHHGCFFGCGMKGRLERVQTLPPDDKAVQLVLAGGQGLFLDPAEARAFLGGGDPHPERWLEFHLAAGFWVQVELAASSAGVSA
jgi:hypothetical protein